MPIATKAIVLSSLKYGETSIIIKAFTEAEGLKSYLLKGVRSSKKKKLKPAYFFPLMQLEIVATHKNKGTLDTLHQAKALTPCQTLYIDRRKNSLVLFLAEILTQSLRQQEQDKALFRYLEYALQWLDQHEAIANFHLLFLLHLTKHFGFYPDTAYQNAPYFDLLEGNFCNTLPPNPLLEGQSLKHFKAILDLPLDALPTLHIGKHHRQELLKKLVLYFELHIHGFQKPKSLAVLTAIFQ